MPTQTHASAAADSGSDAYGESDGFDDDGFTALHHAAAGGHVEAAILLLKAGMLPSTSTGGEGSTKRSAADVARAVA